MILADCVQAWPAPWIADLVFWGLMAILPVVFYLVWKYAS